MDCKAQGGKVLFLAIFFLALCGYHFIKLDLLIVNSRSLGSSKLL